jgi:hypothetical protein
MSPLRFVWLLIGWGMVLLVVYFSLTPQLPPLGVQLWDKANHAAAYCLLMLWFAQLRWRRLPLALGLLALGGGLELAQGLTGHRQASGLDLLANAIGIAAGWLLARALPNPLQRLEARRS